jgi:hypothetical protein
VSIVRHKASILPYGAKSSIDPAMSLLLITQSQRKVRILPFGSKRSPSLDKGPSRDAGWDIGWRFATCVLKPQGPEHDNKLFPPTLGTEVQVLGAKAKWTKT